MITGDHPDTAWAIATALGIVEDQEEEDPSLMLNGNDLDRMSQTKLSSLQPFPR